MKTVVCVYKNSVTIKIFAYPFRHSPLVIKDMPYKYSLYLLEFRSRGFAFVIDFYNDLFFVNSSDYFINTISERHFKGCTVYVLDCSIKDLFNNEERK